jgi:NAD+ kinase
MTDNDGLGKSSQNNRIQCKVHQLLECQRREQRARRRTALKDVSENKVMDKTSNGEVDHHDGFYSRLMTKKQLSEMALGVRDLSKRLGSVKLRINVKTVFVLTKIVDNEVIEKSRELVEWLLSKEQTTPYIVSVIFSYSL